MKVLEGERPGLEGLAALGDRLAAVIESAVPCVVAVRARRARRRAAVQHGSGLLVREGHVVTNAHVTGRGASIEVEYPDGVREVARVQGVDPRTDLAVLRIERPVAATLAWGDSEGLRAGDLVLAIANPLLVRGTVTVGIVSAPHRVLGRRGPRGGHWIDGVVQADTAVAPGSSGGALLTPAGRLVGVIMASNASHRGLAFAVPSLTAEWVVDELCTYGVARRARLGMDVKTVPVEGRAAGLPVARCVLVKKVVQGQPGDRAGLRPGDRLLAANGRPLTGVHMLQRVLGIGAVGSEVAIDFLRDGSTQRTYLVPLAVGAERPGLGA